MAPRRIDELGILDVGRPGARIPAPPPAILDAPPPGVQVFSSVPRVLDAPPPGVQVVGPAGQSGIPATRPSFGQLRQSDVGALLSGDTLPPGARLLPESLEPAPDPESIHQDRVRQFQTETARRPLMQPKGRTALRPAPEQPRPEPESPEDKARRQAVESIRRTEGEPGMIDFVAEAFSGIGNAAIRSVGSLSKHVALFEKAAKMTFPGMAEGLRSTDGGPIDVDPEGYAKGFPSVKEQAEQIRLGIVKRVPEPAVQDYLFFKIGQGIQDFGDAAFPGDPRTRDSFVRSVGEGLGSMAAIMGSGVLGRIIAGPGALAQVVSSGMAGSALEAEALFAEAKAHGQPDDQAIIAWAAGLPIGLTEFAPVGKILDRYDKASGGQFKKGVRETIKRWAKDGAKGTLQEGAQEFGQGTMSNIAVKALIDDERQLSEGLIEQGGAGGTVGLITSLAATALGGRRARLKRKAGGGAVSGLDAAMDANQAPQSTDAPIVPESPGLRPEPGVTPLPDAGVAGLGEAVAPEPIPIPARTEATAPPPVLDAPPPGAIIQPAEGVPDAITPEGRPVQPGEQPAPRVPVKKEPSKAEAKGDIAQEEVRRGVTPKKEVASEKLAKLRAADKEVEARLKKKKKEKERAKSPTRPADEVRPVARRDAEPIPPRPVDAPVEGVVGEEGAPAGPKPGDVDVGKRMLPPEALTFTETEQHNLSEVRKLIGPETDPSDIDPIVAVAGAETRIIDGHNRATVLRERGKLAPVVTIPEAAYDSLKSQGFDDIEISAATLERADEYGASSRLAAQFVGADLEQRSEQAGAALHEFLKPKEPTRAKKQPVRVQGQRKTEVRPQAKATLKPEAKRPAAKAPDQGDVGKAITVTPASLPKKFPPVLPPASAGEKARTKALAKPGPRIGRTVTPVTFVKKFIQTVPEFKDDPTFTFDGEQLVHKDGGTFRLNPNILGLDAATLSKGQVVRVDLNSFGVKAPKKPASILKPKKPAPALKPTKPSATPKAAGGKFDPTQFKIEKKQSSIGLLPITFQEGKTTERFRRGGFAGFGPPARIGAAPPGALNNASPRITIYGKTKDITFAQRYVWALINAAHSSGDPLVIKAAETLIDLDVRRMQDADAATQRDSHAFNAIPKKLRPKLFKLMDEYIPPDAVEGRTDIPDALKPGLKYFKTEAEKQRLEVIGIKRKMALQMFMNMTKAKLAVEMRNRNVTPPGERWTKPQVAKLLSENAIPNDWGRQYSYIPHMFFGQYQLSWTDSDGNTHGGIGAAETQAQAFDKLWHFRANNPNLDIARLDAKPDIVIPPDMLRVSTGRLGVLKKQLKDAADLANDEVQQALRGVVGQKQSRKKFWGSLMQRKGAEGFEKDFLRVWTMNIHGFTRWKYLNEMNRRTVPAIETLRANGKPNWASYLEGTLDFVWGRKPDVVVDNFDAMLQHVPFVSQYFRPQALTRWLAMVRTVNYVRHLQTGRFFVVNNLQPLQTLWPVIGERGMYRAYKLAFSKEGAEILRRHNVTGLGKFLEDERMLQLGKFTPAGASEASNQRIAFLGLYDFARNRMGMTDEAAAKYARLRGQVMTQFLFTRANQPPMLRHPVTQTMFQYKSFPIKNLGLAVNMWQGRAGLGRVGGVSRWFLAQFVLGGVKVLWPTTIAGVLGRGYLGHALWQWLKDEYGEETADAVTFGAPALAGVDLSGSVNVIETPYGRTSAEKIGNTLLGPTGQTVSRIVSRATDPKKVVDEGIAESIAKGFVETSSTLKQFEALVKWIDGDTSQLDARGRKRNELEGWDLLKKVFGFRTVHESVGRLQLDAIFAFKQEYDGVMDKAARKLAAFDYAGTFSELAKWNSLHPEAWVNLDDVKARAKSRRESKRKTQLERLIDTAPKKVRRVLRSRRLDR